MGHPTKAGRQRVYDDDDRARGIGLYRSLGRNLHRTSRMSGIPKTTLAQWVRRYGPRYGERGGQDGDEDGAAAGELFTDEGLIDQSINVPDVLDEAAIAHLRRIRALYLRRLEDAGVMERTTARDASSIVQAATAQIQLLAGQQITRTLTRYVAVGALRELAHKERLRRLGSGAVSAGEGVSEAERAT